MGTPLVDVVQGYATLASSLLERWGAHATAVASRIDAGTYDAESAAADLATSAALATESGFLLASEAIDAVAILTGRQRQPHIVRSQTFSTSLTGATLALTGPLTNGFGSDALPVSVVSVEPSQLAGSQTEFSLSADATGHRGATYVGVVEASRSGTVESVTVWIVVP